MQTVGDKCRARGYVEPLSVYQGEREYSYTTVDPRECRSGITRKEIMSLEKNHPIRRAFAEYRKQQHAKRFAYRKRNKLTLKQFWELLKRS